jgi:hypothetical protein
VHSAQRNGDSQRQYQRSSSAELHVHPSVPSNALAHAHVGSNSHAARSDRARAKRTVFAVERLGRVVAASYRRMAGGAREERFSVRSDGGRTR